MREAWNELTPRDYSKGMMKKINESPAIVKTVFNLAYTMKRNVPLVGGILDKAVFAKVGPARMRGGQRWLM